MDTLKEDLLRALECPVCFDYMLPPITLCCNGHNICNTCKPRLDKCPICQGNLVNIRNRCAEDLSASIVNPCKFQKAGCKRKFRMGSKQIHEHVCAYGPHKCPYYLVPRIKCHWEGTALNIKRHIENAHTNHGINVIINPGIQSCYNPDYLKWIKGANWHQSVFTFEKICFSFDKIIEDFLYMCIMYVGSREDDNKYKYTITIKNSDGKQSDSLCLLCPNYLDIIDREFPNEKCAAFYKDFTKQCFNDQDQLIYEYEISQI